MMGGVPREVKSKYAAPYARTTCQGTTLSGTDKAPFTHHADPKPHLTCQGYENDPISVVFAGRVNPLGACGLEP